MLDQSGRGAILVLQVLLLAQNSLIDLTNLNLNPYRGSIFFKDLLLLTAVPDENKNLTMVSGAQ